MQLSPITAFGSEKLKEKLAKLKEEFATLPAIIKTAREKGDLKENAEYHAAREKQGMLQAEINQVSSGLASAQIIDPKTLIADRVTFGKKVTVRLQEDDQSYTYCIVGSAESLFWEGGLSIQSEVAKALLGKKVADICVVRLQGGEKSYRIEKIEVI